MVGRVVVQGEMAGWVVEVDGGDDDVGYSCGMGEERQKRDGWAVVWAMMGLMVDDDARSLVYREECWRGGIRRCCCSSM
jgi:hypothetical protein